MWVFERKNGLLSQYGQVGLDFPVWAGNGQGKNNPAAEQLHDVGPLPAGFYVAGPPEDNHKTGLYSLSLTPYPKNQMFNRSGFYFHGSVAISNPLFGQESDGCIVGSYTDRQFFWNSGDHLIKVV